jgi:hypothetical protein
MLIAWETLASAWLLLNGLDSRWAAISREGRYNRQGREKQTEVIVRNPYNYGSTVPRMESRQPGREGTAKGCNSGQ